MYVGMFTVGMMSKKIQLKFGKKKIINVSISLLTLQFTSSIGLETFAIRTKEIADTEKHIECSGFIRQKFGSTKKEFKFALDISTHQTEIKEEK